MYSKAIQVSTLGMGKLISLLYGSVAIVVQTFVIFGPIIQVVKINLLSDHVNSSCIL